MSAVTLIEVVKELGAPFGLERSIKIMTGVLAEDRCLLSVGRTALGKAPAERLAEIGRRLHMPARFSPVLPAALEHAEVIHFGYEGGDGSSIYKLYFEYASRVRQAMAAESRIPVLVHLAYKWVSNGPDKAAVTRYSWLPCRTRADIEAKLKEALPIAAAATARRCLCEIVSRTARFADSGELLLMEVEEPGNPRRSYDLNVYDAGLRMLDIGDLVGETLQRFQIPRHLGQEAFARSQNKALGHVAGGVGRDEREFVTVYFGVESHGTEKL